MRDFLSAQQVRALRMEHRKERDRRVADRMKAVLLCNGGWSWPKIAEALMLDEDSIRRHVKEYMAEGKLAPENGGSESKLSTAQTKALLAHLEAKTYRYVHEICAYVQETYGIAYTVAGMTSWLHGHGFSYKKPAPVPSKADPAKQEAFIQYYESLMHHTPEDEPILFVDGVHPTMATKVSSGWIRKGVRKPIDTTGNRTRLNIMGALNLSTMSLDVTYHERLSAQEMDVFFAKLRGCYPAAPKIHMILDQSGYHKGKDTQCFAKKHGIVLHYLPPYSPNLNPIERCWKVMNEQVRNNQFFASAKEFTRSIQQFFTDIWPDIAHSMTDRIHDTFQQLPASSF